MDGLGQVSLTRLWLLWTAGLALCAVNLRDNVFLLPVALLVSVVVCLVSLCRDTAREVWWMFGAVLVVAFLGVAFVQFWIFASPHLDQPWGPALAVAYAVLGVAGATLQRGGGWAFAAFLAVHVLLVAVLMRSMPVVSDVQALLDGGADALLGGTSPYAITVPGVYDSGHDWIYGPGVLVDGRITYGYPYLPIPLLVVVPAYLLGDVRIAVVLAMVVSAVLVRRLADDRLGRVAAVLLLVMPVSWATSLSYWIEPILLLFVVCLAHALQRGTNRAAFWFGCFLASKQYAVVHLPYLWMLARASGRRAVLVALAVPAVLCSVFFLWDPRAFLHSAVEFHLKQPLRYDTVTLTPALQDVLGDGATFLLGPYGFVLGAAASALVAWRCRPGAATFAAGIGLSLAVSVLFSKQGHPNYWDLIGGALLVAVVTYRESPRTPQPRWHTPAGDLAEPLRHRG
ncbi:hypothetical protein [Nocardioides currus]|uniref:DUF2029 domain-containing protein n=1 Tax=Nocardioides currus TaxID=2133958 RepID=A0A2R7YWA1_9ACTN|nr:hypothetical protein [Nocardioides currus]PUA80601.1 hypothetical protein C7S10_12640 [Nocardioides currus]